MFCSIVIPTVNRPTLCRAVESALGQTLHEDSFEVVVVNDSGEALPHRSWQESRRVRVIDTKRRRLCTARNAGASIARGKYLNFLDDDDWLLDGTLSEFWRLSQDSPDAIWLYGGVEFVDGRGRPLGSLNLKMSGNCFAQVLGGAWIPAQSSLIKTDVFFQVGGFDPLLGPGEELDLCARCCRVGELANTSAPVVCLLRGEGWSSTVDYSVAVDFNRRIRDAAIASPGSFRLLTSTARTAYWRGRVAKTYLSALNWNLRQRRLTDAASRALHALACFLSAGTDLLKGKFWRGVRDSLPQCSSIAIAPPGS